jgi:predicted oxidoreductase
VNSSAFPQKLAKFRREIFGKFQLSAKREVLLTGHIGNVLLNLRHLWPKRVRTMCISGDCGYDN